jgi:superfamily II DNA or RNA helicase
VGQFLRITGVPNRSKPDDPPAVPRDSSRGSGELSLTVTLDQPAGIVRFDWRREGQSEPEASGFFIPSGPHTPKSSLDWELIIDGQRATAGCSSAFNPIRGLVGRILQRIKTPESRIVVGVLSGESIPGITAGEFAVVGGLHGEKKLDLVAKILCEFAACSAATAQPGEPDPRNRGRSALREILLGQMRPSGDAGLHRAPVGTRLRITMQFAREFIQLEWTDAGGRLMAEGRITWASPEGLKWRLKQGKREETTTSSIDVKDIRAILDVWRARFPVADEAVSACAVITDPDSMKAVTREQPPFGKNDPPWPYLESNVAAMGETLRMQYLAQVDPEQLILQQGLLSGDFERLERRLLKREERLREEEEKRRKSMARLAEERRKREEARRQEAAGAAARAKGMAPGNRTPAAPPPEREPLPPVPVRVEVSPFEVQDTAFPLADLRGYFLRERSARWWVSNQSDDLLALPYCNIQRLDYQIRSALRVLGPLRGRALLSDEVGLGKTIEAGLVLKELLIRGMVKRFLVLTVPSLVDQWEEELIDKFNLPTVTTNHASARSDAGAFWRENPAIVASLHTVKQAAHVEIARTVKWDLLIVDEAHYLRNRDSLAWQAVNALPRQFLLLLTATPVQNSLEELYNLVTLLQPGQLPTPKEFRARFMDPKRPRQPREPEELRRLLGQVMIRNTRSNAGINLPPRRAETVVFEPAESERTQHQQWEAELRTELGALPPGQASLWGRLLLQAAGSSPGAWRGALEKFPNPVAGRDWSGRVLFETAWRKKCEVLPGLSKVEGGLVVFTQFLETQSALARFLEGAGVRAHVIHGGTPAAQRQPIAEAFRKAGGALLLTHSGTEGRNLQFCHRLVNFDLPWNPMEIEQRIGRLHRLGQKNPVQIYNLVQAGTLQEHLLQILQEKLNLFELVVGETGLILGEKFGSDEFAEEILRRWRESGGEVAGALQTLGDELAAARDGYQQVKQLDETLFAKDYESI